MMPDHPGVSIARLVNGEKPERTVLSEYHGMGSTTGAFAIRNGKYKYVRYVRYAPQLFDLEADPARAPKNARPSSLSVTVAVKR